MVKLHPLMDMLLILSSHFLLSVLYTDGKSMIDEQGKKNLIKASYVGEKKQIKHEKRVRKQKIWRTLIEQI